LELTETAQVERSAKGTGIDYWLGDGREERGIFQRTAHLEVSGILLGDKRKLASRLREKVAQTQRSDQWELRVYAVIVEFIAPEASFVGTAEERVRE
jgi:hypothetical protein